MLAMAGRVCLDDHRYRHAPCLEVGEGRILIGACDAGSTSTSPRRRAVLRGRETLRLLGQRTDAGAGRIAGRAMAHSDFLRPDLQAPPATGAAGALPAATSTAAPEIWKIGPAAWPRCARCAQERVEGTGERCKAGNST